MSPAVRSRRLSVVIESGRWVIILVANKRIVSGEVCCDGLADLDGVERHTPSEEYRVLGRGKVYLSVTFSLRKFLRRSLSEAI